jgi:hypothetical protein
MGNCVVTTKKRTGVLPTGTGRVVDIALSASYATGGDTVTLASLGVSSLNALLCGGATTPGGHAVEVIHGAADTTAPLLRIRDAATGAQLANASDHSAQSVRALVIGDLTNI